MLKIDHRFIDTNGIRMHIAEAGAGPLVLLCHGFPESWYSWRHQLGRSPTQGSTLSHPTCAAMDRPTRPKRSSIHAASSGRRYRRPGGCAAKSSGDRRARLGRPRGVARCAAASRSFPRVIGLSVPFRPRCTVPPTTVMPKTDDAVFYQLYFQAPGVAEADFERTLVARFTRCSSRLRRWAPLRGVGRGVHGRDGSRGLAGF